jgi:hypothetical protein
VESSSSMHSFGKSDLMQILLNNIAVIFVFVEGTVIACYRCKQAV